MQCNYYYSKFERRFVCLVCSLLQALISQNILSSSESKSSKLRSNFKQKISVHLLKDLKMSLQAQKQLLFINLCCNFYCLKYIKKSIYIVSHQKLCTEMRIVYAR